MSLHESLFASAIPVRKTITLKLADGGEIEHEFFIKELPAIDMRRQILAEQSSDEKTVSEALSALISRALCDIDGKAVMTIKQANQLKPHIAGALRDLIMEVNGFGGKKPNEP
jgi:hypothetical protein